MDWINEDEAAKKLNYKSARAFRRNVIANKLPINYRTTNGRKYQYSEIDIADYQKKTSTAA